MISARTTPAKPSRTTGGRLDRFFEITARGTTWGTEVRGGVLTFVTMAYTVILNPLILGGTKDVVGH
ncbi:MAG TPA: NCS2 family permease, partial [Leifsonia sp.]